MKVPPGLKHSPFDPLSAAGHCDGGRGQQSLCFASCAISAGRVSPRGSQRLTPGDRPAERMAVEVTYPIEEALRSIPGVRASAPPPAAAVRMSAVNFDWGQDMVSAMLQAQSQVNQIAALVTRGHHVRSPADGSDGVPRHRLQPDVRHTVAHRAARPGHVRPAPGALDRHRRGQGGRAGRCGRGISASSYDPGKLQPSASTRQRCRRALSGRQRADGGGQAGRSRQALSGRLRHPLSRTRRRSAKRSSDRRNGVVRLSRCGDRVGTEHGSRNSPVSTADGHDAVLLQVYQQPGGNTVQIAKGDPRRSWQN